MAKLYSLSTLSVVFRSIGLHTPLIADDRIMEAFVLLNNRFFTDDQENEILDDVTQMIEEEEGPLNHMCIFGKDESGWYLVSGGGDSLVK